VKSLSPGHCFAQKRNTHVQNIPRIVSISTRELFWRVDFQNVQDIAQNNAGVDFRAPSGQIHSLKSKDDDFIASGHHQTLILHNFIICFHKKVWVDVAVEYYEFWKQILCRSICLARDTTEANAACIQFIFHRFTY
jgi:hypothetical protein